MLMKIIINNSIPNIRINNFENCSHNWSILFFSLLLLLWMENHENLVH